MKRIREYIVKIAAVALVVAYCLHTSSCANTSGAPTGGPRDSIPPVILGTTPDTNAVNVPRVKTEIVLTFNEYVQVKEASKNIFLSPPQKKAPQSKIKGKSVVITFPEDLDSNCTYALNFGNALADNNEGNVLANYVFSFSTGNTIDSMLISGTVLDNETLLPLKGVSVALYENPTDSCMMNNLPSAITRSDEWGYFCLRNLKPVPYAVYAFKDDVSNHKYDMGTELVGFLDSLETPTVVMHPGLAQLGVYDEKDTVGLLSRPSEYTIYMFKERNTNQFISDYKMFSRRGAYIKFNAPDVIIEKFEIGGIAPENILKQFNQTNDSLVFWMNTHIKERDTLTLKIRYHKTDTLGNNVPTDEELQFTPPFEKEEDKELKKDDQGNTIRKDLLNFDLKADAKMVEQEGYVFEFSEPLVESRFDTISLVSSTPKGVKAKEEFTVTRDTLNIRRYVLRPVNQFIVGNDYILRVPEKIFKDVNGNTNDSLMNKLILPTSDNASSITLEVMNVDARYMVELVNDKRDKVYRRHIINRDTILLFPYLDKGNYSIRITEDKNSNELLDPGSVLGKRQPEMVRLYKLPMGNDIIALEEKTDLEQSVDVQQLFDTGKKSPAPAPSDSTAVNTGTTATAAAEVTATETATETAVTETKAEETAAK